MAKKPMTPAAKKAEKAMIASEGRGKASLAPPFTKKSGKKK